MSKEESLIQVIIYSDNLKKVKRLVEEGANVNARININDGITILMLAIEQGRCKIVKYLLETNKLDINMWDSETPWKDSRNALTFAMQHAQKHNIEIAEMLLKKGAIMRESDIKTSLRNGGITRLLNPSRSERERKLADLTQWVIIPQVCMVLVCLDLTPYVLQWILEWVTKVNGLRILRLIEGVMASREKVLAAREKKLLECEKKVSKK